jgi:hypothetical protein
VHQVLAAQPIAEARTRGLGRNDTLKAIKAALRRVRFPHLASVEEQLAGLVRDLGLPRNVRVMLPDFLEGDQVRIEIVAQSTAAWRAAAASLLAAAETTACSDLFTLLGEAP